MNDIQLALVLLGAFWTGTSAVFTGLKNAGELRDKIVLGKIGTVQLPLAYLRQVFWMDWLPLKLSLSAISLVLGVIILMLPAINPEGAPRFRTICQVAAVMPITGFLFQLVSATAEGILLFRTMEQTSERRTDEINEASRERR